MSGETGVQTASPSPNVAAEDVPDHPLDSDTDTVNNETSVLEDVADVDLEVSQVDIETKELPVQETTRLIEDEELSMYNSVAEVEEKMLIDVTSHEKNDNSDKHSVHSVDTIIESDGESIDQFPDKKMLRNREYDESEDYSDDEDEDRQSMYDEEEEDSAEDEDMDEKREEVSDECTFVEDLVSDEECVESPLDGGRASSDDFERRKNNITKSDIEGKKSLSCQDFTDPNFTTEPKKESAKVKVDNNRVINPLKNASKVSKPGPKSYKVQSKVSQYIKDIKSTTAEEQRKKEEKKLKEAEQNENHVIGNQQRPILRPPVKVDPEKQAKIIQKLQNEFARANAEHDPKYADVRPISTDKQVEIRVPNLNIFNSGLTIKPLNEEEAKSILNKIDKEEKKAVQNGSVEQQDQINYNDYMKPQLSSVSLVQQLAQENAALKKQLEELRWREHESKKKTCDVGVQTDSTRTLDTSTSISDWSEFPNVTLPSLDHSTQTTNNLSDRLSNTFLTSSRILETFNAISAQLKEDESSESFAPGSRKRKLPEKETDDMRCMIYKESENSAERSFMIEVQDPSQDEKNIDMQVNRKCGPYRIGNLDIMMSEFNGTINVWGKEVSETNQNASETPTTQNAALHQSERRTLKARRNLNPRMVCSTEKKKSPPRDHNHLGYRNHACHSRQLECASPPRYHHSHYNRCNSHSCRNSSCHQPMPEKRHCRCEHSRGHQDEAEHDYYDGQEPETSRERDYCCPNEDRATGSGSNAWNRVEAMYNGKVDSGVHSDTLSNQDEEPDYLQNLGFIENKAKKRKLTGKNFLGLLKSCGSDFRQSFANRRNIPGHRPSTSTADFVQDTNRSVYMPSEDDRRFKSEKSRARPSAETKTARNLYPDHQGN